MNPLWTEIAARAQIVLTDEQVALLNKYLDILFEANATMNLTRIPDRAAAEVQHIADAFMVLPFIKPGPLKLADVGSGGGVPGIPLAIARPDIQVLLIESTKKKAAFLTTAVAALALPNVTVLAQRAEEVGLSEQREKFDVVVARAVATLDWLAEWCLPLVRRNGKFLAMKGPKVLDEIPLAAKAIKLVGGGPPVVHSVALGELDQRVIVEIEKIGRCDKRYPRESTLTKGRPLGHVGN